MGTIPERIPATGTDAAVSITRSVTHHRIGLRLVFDGRLDPERMSRAVRLSLEAEPILGCSFETDSFRPYWKRIADLDSVRAFSVAESIDVERQALRFQAAEIPDSGPQSAVVLLRGDQQDEIGIKVSHVLADGQAAKQYAYLLADIYTRLGTDPSYVPEANLTPRPTAEDVWRNLTVEQRRGARKAKSWANPTWRIPTTSRTGRDLTYRRVELAPQRFIALKAYGKARGATVNDLMLTAFFRAAVRAFTPPVGEPLAVMCTADLRRFIPRAEQLPLANISISGPMDLHRVDGERFDETLKRVCDRTAAWKRACYGAGPARNAEKLTALGYRVTRALLETTFRMSGKSGKTYPWFTNIGVIDEARLSFDGRAPSAAYVIGPAAIGASIVPTVSTYRDTLTVCMGFCEADLAAEVIERVLRLITNEVRALPLSVSAPMNEVSGQDSASTA